MRGLWLLGPSALLGLLVAGCVTGPDDFQATASDAWIFTGYDYMGRSATKAEGRLEVSLDTDGNAGRIRATAQDRRHAYEVRWNAFHGSEDYKSGGVARDLDLWGATGNGSGTFPKVTVYAAAFGNATFLLDGASQREPRILSAAFDAALFIAKGRYRDPSDHRILRADQNGTFDPDKPGDGFVDRQGAQAAVLLYTARGELFRYLEYNSVSITRR